MIFFSARLQQALPFSLLACFFIISYFLRPLLPVDETRYLSVSWEMLTRDSFLVPTLNFAPYFQKPPLLFWLIDLAWAVFGVSRAAAMVVVFCISSAVILLMERLARTLFPGAPAVAQRIPWITLGGAVFLIYSTLILFDLLLTVFVILTMLALLTLARTGTWMSAMLAGIAIGLGILAKGPVMLIHVVWPIVLYPMWRNCTSDIPATSFYARMPILLGFAVVTVALWLVPAISSTGWEFAYNLVWRQTAGRVSGSISGAHRRPFYFYLALLPVALMPWILWVDFWRSKLWLSVCPGQETPRQDLRVLRFLLVWIAGTVVVFSMISGKQPHYLVPALAPLGLTLAYMMTPIPVTAIRNSALVTLALFSGVQIAGKFTFFRPLDLRDLAEVVSNHRDANWAFADRYEGELTFLGRFDRPFQIVPETGIAQWLATHPSGYLIRRSPHYPDAAHIVVARRLADRGYYAILRGSENAAP